MSLSCRPLNICWKKFQRLRDICLGTKLKIWILTDDFPFSFHSRVLVFGRLFPVDSMESIHSAGLTRSGCGREGVGKRAAAGYAVTMVARSSSSLPSTALLFLFECIVKVFLRENQINKTHTQACLLLAYVIGEIPPTLSVILGNKIIF